MIVDLWNELVTCYIHIQQFLASDLWLLHYQIDLRSTSLLQTFQDQLERMASYIHMLSCQSTAKQQLNC